MTLISEQKTAINIDDGVLAWLDKETGLMWEVKTQETIGYWYCWHKTYTQALDITMQGIHPNIHDCTSYVEWLNSNKYAGFSDWRIPEVSELETLLEPLAETKKIKLALSHNSYPAYWSNTPNIAFNVFRVSASSYKDTAHIPGVKIIDFDKGFRGNYAPSNTLWLRCVRNA
ncbi:DUF1566 domain-containing protein [Shewanella sp. 10N.286.51.B2]|uniref:Lcl C-terminal domain-containing protein n=1 Tax=Shewanella sp. 10N.286.51.B2 TaxID=3229707 RepID=UPI00354FB96D